MILDSIANSNIYASISPRITKAFEYIHATDLAALSVGTHKIDGDDIFINIMECELKDPQDAKLEVHNQYVDIQVLIEGKQECFGYSNRNKLESPIADFDSDRDIQFFEDAPQIVCSIEPEEFIMLFPDDAHAPLIGSGVVKKGVVKVRL